MRADPAANDRTQQIFTERAQEIISHCWEQLHDAVPEMQGFVAIPVWDMRLGAVELPFAYVHGDHASADCQLRTLYQLHRVMQNRVDALLQTFTALEQLGKELAGTARRHIADAQTKTDAENEEQTAQSE